MSVCACTGGPNCCRYRLEGPNLRFGVPPLIDIDRMRRALTGPSFDMPPGLTREEKRRFILDAAERHKVKL